VSIKDVRCQVGGNVYPLLTICGQDSSLNADDKLSKFFFKNYVFERTGRRVLR